LSVATPTRLPSRSLLGLAVETVIKLLRIIGMVPRLLTWLLTSPFKLIGWFRRSITVASGTLLVVSIASLNIIWGYPWLGIFAACLSLFVLGRLISTLMSPKLTFHLNLPRSVPIDVPLSISIKCRNRGRFPAMQFLVAFDRRSLAGRKWLRRNRPSRTPYQTLSAPHPVQVLEPNKTERLGATIRFTHRGTHELPQIITRSYFPFYLFQVTQHQNLREEIAVTPRPLDVNEDEAAKGFLESMGEWSHQLLAGDALDYTGSREYQVGMPVRRWDFNSWARLGKPIVREYQSPSVQQVYLIIDTAQDAENQFSANDFNPHFERLLSAATTVILELNKQRVQLQMCLTCGTDRQSEEGGFTQLDTESMLIRLANAAFTTTETSNQQMDLALESVHQAPTLILSNRDVQSFPDPLPRTVRWITVHADETAATSSRGKRN